MKKTLLSVSIIVLFITGFGAGVYAAEKGWLNFEGEQQAEDTKGNIESIMDIMDNLNDGKINAEEAQKELEKEIKKKQDRIDELEAQADDNKDSKEHIKHLEKELERANKAVNKVFEKSEKELENAKKYE